MFRSTSPRLMRVVAWLSLALYLAAAAGLPVPVATTADSGELYPCAGHVCGCSSAEHCWRQCCCYTPREKLAWAERHGVTPPDYAEKAAPRSCCGQKHDHAEHDHVPEQQEASEATITWQLAIQARRCGGQADNWLMIPPGVMPKIVAYSHLESPSLDRVALWPETAPSLDLSPPVPPPRLAA
jgi:hypothetical protein